MSSVRIESHGPLATVRLDKERANAIDASLVEDLIGACAEVERDETVRGVLLASSHPKVFSPGLDLVGLLDNDRPAMRAFMLRFAEMVWALYGLSKPLVAAVGGHAIAGGCVLALTADRRILRGESVTIGLNEIRVGIPLPWSVALLLRANARPERVAEAALIGKNYAGQEAIAVGFAHEIAPAESFDAVCLARLEEMAEKEAAAFAVTKRYLRSETLAAMKSREESEIDRFLDSWFSEATRRRIRDIVASLARPKNAG